MLLAPDKLTATLVFEMAVVWIGMVGLTKGVARMRHKRRAQPRELRAAGQAATVGGMADMLSSDSVELVWGSSERGQDQTPPGIHVGSSKSPLSSEVPDSPAASHVGVG